MGNKVNYKSYTTRISNGYDMLYLGVYENEISVHDFANLDKDAERISINKKTKNLDKLPEFTSLRYVGLGRDSLSEDIVSLLSELPRLEIMQISHDRQEVWPSLQPLKSLKYLILYDVKKLTSLDPLRGLVQLESLFLSELLSLGDIGALRSLNGLREFALEGDLHGRGSILPEVEALFSLSKLEYLKFFSKKTQLTASDFQSFKRLSYLHISPRQYSFEFYAELDRYLPESSKTRVPLLTWYEDSECPKCEKSGLVKPIGSRQKAFCPRCNSAKLNKLLQTYETLSGRSSDRITAILDF